jgi:hypothetical protein
VAVDWGVITGTVGAITGTAAFVWRVVDEFGAYLRLTIKVDTPSNGWTTALTTIENKGNRCKGISNAFLLIGPEYETPVHTANYLAEKKGNIGKFSSPNEFRRLKLMEPFFSGERGIVPLSFYYDENVDVADETPTYRAPIKIEGFSSETPYSVRFFVFADGSRLHRLTHDAFVCHEQKLSDA